MALSCLTMFHYIVAMFDGPGYVPKKWEPKDANEKPDLQYCSTCEGFKAPRAHHCRKCE